MDVNRSDRLELFIFPDGTAMEIIVFGPAPKTGHDSPRRQRSAPAAHAAAPTPPAGSNIPFAQETAAEKAATIFTGGIFHAKEPTPAAPLPTAKA